MTKIKITEKQAKRLGLTKITENEESGLKSSGIAMGELVVRVVIYGPTVPTMKDRILALIHRQDPESTVGFFEATGKIVGNIKEIRRKSIERDLKALDPSITIEKKAMSAPKLKEGVRNIVQISKDQYNRIFAAGLINESDMVKGGLTRVDKEFKKEFAGKNVQNIKPVSEENFNISKPNKSIAGNQKFNKAMTENEGTESSLHKEVMELIKFLYRKSEELSPFWEQQGITYDKLCDTLLSKGIIISKNGKYELSKKLGDPQQAIKALEDQVSALIPDQQGVETEAYPMIDAPQTDAPPLETESGYPTGTANDTNAPWNQKEPDTRTPEKPKEVQLTPVAYNDEMIILKDPKGNLYGFYHWGLDKSDWLPYASVPRHYVGKDDDGQPDYDYDEDSAVKDADVVTHYVNDNLANLSKGEGLEAWENGVDLVKIDEPLKKEMLSLYDKDKNLVKILGPMEEGDWSNGMGSFKDNIVQARTPKPNSGESPEQTQNRIVTKLQKLKKQEEERRGKESAEIKARRNSADVEETTAASSGAFTAPLATAPLKKNTNIPVVGETTTAGAGNFQYDANALPGIGRNGEFKQTKKTKAQKTPQWSGGEFVKQPACSKLNNNKAAANGGCNQGASSLNTVKAKGSINAPSLGENEIYEAIANKTGKSIDEIRKIIETKKSKA